MRAFDFFPYRIIGGNLYVAGLFFYLWFLNDRVIPELLVYN